MVRTRTCEHGSHADLSVIKRSTVAPAGWAAVADDGCESAPFGARCRANGQKRTENSGRSDQNKAIARWDNEGGAAKGPPQEHRDELAALGKEEEHVLRCLGAAVIMHWNELPANIQRELFEHAISMGELRHTAALKRQIVRFLHKHEDGDRRA
jgi:hypothetical protein